MTLDRHYSEGHGYVQVRLVSCPLCGKDFEDHEPRWLHFLDEHGPEDAGLSPLGEITANDGPLFDDPEDVEHAGGVSP